MRSDLQLNRTVLNNGLTVITNKVQNSKIVAINYVVEVGSFYEKKYPSGISHFLEHMMMNGTKTRSKKEIYAAIQYLGGKINAGTSFYHTDYNCIIIHKNWKNGVEILSDIVWNAKISNGDIEKEKSVISQEISTLRDDPINHIKDSILLNLFPNDPEKHSVIGTYESVNSITKNLLDNFRNQYYTPSRTTLIISGDVEHEEITTLVEGIKISKGQVEDIELCSSESIKKLNSESHFIKNPFEQGYFTCTMYAPSRKDGDYYAYQLIIRLLSHGLSSRLYAKLREDLGLLYALGMDYIDFKDGAVTIFIAISNDNNFREIKTHLMNALNDLKINKISDSELQKVKNNYLFDLYNYQESVKEQNDFIIEEYLYSEISDINTTIEKINSVSIWNIMECSKKYFNNDNYMFIEMNPSTIKEN